MIKLPFAKGKTYYVVGLGVSNDAAITSLQKSGAEVFVWDDNADRLAEYDESMIREPDKVAWSRVKALIAAPGLPPSHAAIQTATEKNVPILCDIDLFAQSEPKTKIIGVTGTNGKSTTIALIHHILNTDGKAQLGGNIGVPVLELNAATKYTVLELSSYQLERAPSLKCEVAILLNITNDHLDWHGTMENYAGAKANIFNHAQVKICGVDDPYCQKIFEAQEGATPLSIKGDLPFNPSDMPRLKGRHNTQNMLAAYLACKSLGLNHETIVKRMASFEGLQHRQFLVRVINGIPYINDSKATNVDAAKVALQSYKSIIWLVGGKPKPGGLSGIEECLSHVHTAYVYGEARADFTSFLKKHGVEAEGVETMDEALRLAHKKAQSLRGEPTGTPSVLLSPACASFDQFDNFEARGEHFIELVKALEDE